MQECRAMVADGATGGSADRRSRVKPAKRFRTERLTVFLPAGEFAALEKFRYETRMPSFAAAVRELLRRGLSGDDKRESGA
jgi:hypothetical protein